MEAEALFARRAAAAAERAFPLVLPVAVPVALLAGILVAIGRRLVQTDTWVALVTGREVARHGLPSVERLTVIAQGHRWVDQQWLAQLALYGVERVGGVGLVVAACLGATLLAFLLTLAVAQARGASPVSLLIWAPAGFLAGPWVAEVRTQSLALPLFAFVVCALLRDPGLYRRSTLWIVPVLCLWANVHGSVVLGAGIVSAYALVSLIRTRRRLPVALLLLAPASVLASPYALKLPSYYWTMLLHPPFGHDIAEWQATTPRLAPLFFVVAAVAAVVVVVRRKRLPAVEWLVLALTVAAAFTALRLTPWFGLALVAILPPLTTKRAAAPSFAGRGATVAASILLVTVAGALVFSAHRDYQGPSDVVAALRAAPPGVHVLADLDLADWVLWEAPQLRGRVAYDGRPELMTRPEFVGEVVRFARLLPGWPVALRGYGLVVTNRAIARRLTRSRTWTAIRAGGGVVLLRRVAASSL